METTKESFFLCLLYFRRLEGEQNSAIGSSQTIFTYSSCKLHPAFSTYRARVVRGKNLDQGAKNRSKLRVNFWAQLSKHSSKHTLVLFVLTGGGYCVKLLLHFRKSHTKALRRRWTSKHRKCNFLQSTAFCI